MKQHFVITGTDTGIGKTVFAAALANALGAYYWKPVQSGLDGETDSDVVMRLGQISKHRIIQEAYKLNMPVSPHLAAKIDEKYIDVNALMPPAIDDPLVIEGAGGLLVPLNESALFIDVFAKWQLPVILCARTSLGTINHTLLSIEAMKRRSILLFGVAFIGPEIIDTQETIARIGDVKVLGRLPMMAKLNPSILRDTFNQNFNIDNFLSGSRYD